MRLRSVLGAASIWFSGFAIATSEVVFDTPAELGLANEGGTGRPRKIDRGQALECYPGGV
jgi:hypothetical protein